MIVCVCNRANDKQIVQAVRDGACCMRDLREQLGVGARCGKCVPMAKSLLHEHADLPARSLSRAHALPGVAGLSLGGRAATVPALAA